METVARADTMHMRYRISEDIKKLQSFRFRNEQILVKLNDVEQYVRIRFRLFQMDI